MGNSNKKFKEDQKKYYNNDTFNNTGIGNIIIGNGTKYHGQWKRIIILSNSEIKRYKYYRHGYGTYTYKNGDTFEGVWNMDVKDGAGIFISRDGSLVESGTWKNGVKHGIFNYDEVTKGEKHMYIVSYKTEWRYIEHLKTYQRFDSMYAGIICKYFNAVHCAMCEYMCKHRCDLLKHIHLKHSDTLDLNKKTIEHEYYSEYNKSIEHDRT